MTRLIIAVLCLFLSAPAFGANWYVDSAATGSATGQSWANAWTAFSSIAWSSVNAGDTIYISGGSTSKTYTAVLTIGKSGSSGSPITIAVGQEAGHSGTVILDGSGGTTARINFGGYEYITIDGNVGGARKIVVQNNSLAGDYPLIYAIGSLNDQSQGIHITFVEVTTAGSGIRLIYAKGTEIDNSWIHNISCEAAIDLDGSMADYSGDLSQYDLYSDGALVHDNIITVNNQGVNDGTGPDAIQGTHGISVYNNTITGVTGTTNCGQHQDGIQLGGSFYLAYNNVFRGLANASMESDWADTACGFTRVYNNVFAQSSTQASSHGIEMAVHSGCATVQDFRIYNNVFADFWGFVAVRLIIDNASTVVTQTEIKNNIVYNSGVFSLGNGNYTCGTGLVIDHNMIVAGAHGGTAIDCDGVSYSPTNPVSGTPDFTSYVEYGTSNDFTLLATSDAIDAGVSLSSYFSTDKLGVSRPQGSAWDVGPYEYGTSPPNPPTNTHIGWDHDGQNVSWFEVLIDALTSVNVGMPVPSGPTYHADLPALAPGQHVVAVRACNSAGCTASDTPIIVVKLGGS